jgi:hypothetical protein
MLNNLFKRTPLVCLILATLFVFIFSGSVAQPDIGGVVGTAQGPNGPVVFVESSKTIVPLSYIDHEVVVTGMFYRLDLFDMEPAATANADRYRPAFPGVSIGHYLITAGTLGGIVYGDGVPYILSNNHVIANSDGCSVGDPIIQPGFYDGGTLDDKIAELARWVPIKRCNHQDFTDEACPINYVDAAVGLITGDVIDADPPDQDVPAEIGMPVYKVGRTSGYTSGTVEYIDGSVYVCCYSGNLAYFENQIITTPMVQGGDSGSVLRDLGYKNAIGLVFAGSHYYSVANSMTEVVNLLQVSFDETAYFYRHHFPIMSKEAYGQSR